MSTSANIMTVLWWSLCPEVDDDDVWSVINFQNIQIWTEMSKCIHNGEYLRKYLFMELTVLRVICLGKNKRNFEYE